MLIIMTNKPNNRFKVRERERTHHIHIHPPCTANNLKNHDEDCTCRWDTGDTSSPGNKILAGTEHTEDLRESIPPDMAEKCLCHCVACWVSDMRYTIRNSTNTCVARISKLDSIYHNNIIIQTSYIYGEHNGTQKDKNVTAESESVWCMCVRVWTACEWD